MQTELQTDSLTFAVVYQTEDGGVHEVEADGRSPVDAVSSVTFPMTMTEILCVVPVA